MRATCDRARVQRVQRVLCACGVLRMLQSCVVDRLHVFGLWMWQVARPELLVAWLLEMAVGSKTTPKGGTAAYLAAQSGSEVPTVCGLRSIEDQAHRGPVWLHWRLRRRTVVAAGALRVRVARKEMACRHAWQVHGDKVDGESMVAAPQGVLRPTDIYTHTNKLTHARVAS